MRNILSAIKLRFEVLSYKRNFYLNKILRYAVPTPLLHYLPHEFTVHSIPGTKLRVVDNFCTREETQYLLNKVHEQLGSTGGTADKPAAASGQESQKSVVLSSRPYDKNILSIIARGAMLAGVSTEHAEQLRVYHFSGNAPDSGVQGFDGTLSSNCLCTLLLFLCDSRPEQPGAMRFEKLNIAIRPQIGRAVFCPNWNKGEITGIEAPRVSIPSGRNNSDGIWVMQLSFQPYPVRAREATLEPLQTRTGLPLEGNETLPAGSWIPSNAK